MEKVNSNPQSTIPKVIQQYLYDLNPDREYDLNKFLSFDPVASFMDILGEDFVLKSDDLDNTEFYDFMLEQLQTIIVKISSKYDDLNVAILLNLQAIENNKQALLSQFDEYNLSEFNEADAYDLNQYIGEVKEIIVKYSGQIDDLAEQAELYNDTITLINKIMSSLIEKRDISKEMKKTIENQIDNMIDS